MILYELWGHSTPVSEAMQSTTVQGRDPISPGARGLMDARVDYKSIAKKAVPDNMASAAEILKSRLQHISKASEIDPEMHDVARSQNMNVEDLTKVFAKRFGSAPRAWAIAWHKEQKSKPKQI